MTEELLKQQKQNSDETIITQQSVSDSHMAELQEKIQQTEATNKVWSPPALGDHRLSWECDRL